MTFLFSLSLSSGGEPVPGCYPQQGTDGYSTTFRVWAGTATNVCVAGTFNNWNPGSHPLVHLTNGIWETTVQGARPGHLYKYVINGTHWKRDPRSARVVHAGNTDSIIYDQQAYQWSSTNFVPPSTESLVVYELHAGTFHDPRTETPGSASLDDARAKLDHIAALGANAVLLMPVMEFPGTHSWGYNPTDLYAVDNLTYGGPDALKRFVDAAHQRGLAVILDVVHNHYGTSDLPGDLEHSLWDFDATANGRGGIYFYQDPAFAMTRWGPRPDYSRPEVRQFIKDNIRMWMTDFRIDGFRWDATKFIRLTDDEQTVIPDGISLMQEINEMIRRDFTNKISIAEDLSQSEYITTPVSQGGLGFDSDWHAGFHHAIIDELANGASINIWRIIGALAYPHHTRRMIYTESHDEAGHPANGQVRVPVTMDPAQPESLTARRKTLLAAGLLMTAPGIPMILQGQELLTTQPFHDVHAIDWSRTNLFPGVMNFFRDAIHLRRNTGQQTGALLEGSVHVETIQLSSTVHVLTMHRPGAAGPEDDLLVIANLSGQDLRDTTIRFPLDGTWYSVLNSDDRAYSPDFQQTGPLRCDVSSSLMFPVNMAPWSMMVMTRTPPPPVADRMHVVTYTEGSSHFLPMRREGRDLWVASMDATNNTTINFEFSQGPHESTTFGVGEMNVRDGLITGRANPGSASNPFQLALANSGTYRFEFNAASREFFIRRIVEPGPSIAHEKVAVAGNFNNYNVSAFLTPATNGLWQGDFIIQQAGNVRFKFTAYETMQASWGANAVVHTGRTIRGRAIAGYSDDIEIAGPVDGRYRFTFNDRTLDYSIERIGPVLSFESMALAGNFNRWSVDPNMNESVSNRWIFRSAISYPGPVEFKFVANQTWRHNWGRANTTLASTDRALPVFPDGGNIQLPGPVDGVFNIIFDSDTLTYSIERTADIPPATQTAMAWAGDFNGWSIEPTMRLNDANEWTTERLFRTAGEIRFKFVAERSWDLSWGDGPVMSALQAHNVASGSQDIVMMISEPGVYRITFNDRTMTYRIERVVRDLRIEMSEPRENNNQQSIRWPSVEGASYTVFVTTNLLSGFAVAADDVPATPPENIFVIPPWENETRFYRVIQR